MSSRRLLVISLVAALSLVSGPVLAVDANVSKPSGPFEPPKIVPSIPAISPDASFLEGLASTDHVTATVTATGDPDEDATLAAEADVKTFGILKIRDHIASLQMVLAHMPRPFVRVSTVNGRVRYRADSMPECLKATDELGKPDAKGVRSLDCGGNPYPSAALYLGSYFNETGQYDQAVQVLDQGLIAGPRSPLLISEKGASLAALRRWPDALTCYDAGLAIENLADRDHARLLRGRGYALTELQRLDESEASYNASLKYEPDNPVALNELKYIARLRSGGPRSPAGVLTSVQPKPK